MQRVGFENPEQFLLTLLEAELRVLRESTTDVSLDDFLYLFLSYADLAECVVSTTLWIYSGDWPGNFAHSFQQPCSMLCLRDIC